MPKDEEHNKHMTMDDRCRIASGLREQYNFREIGEMIGKDPGTVSKEIRRHRYVKRKKRSGMIWDNPCAKQETCRKKNICNKRGKYKCRIPCRKCLVCYKKCTDFKPIICDIEKKAPYVCNGCPKFHQCNFDKYIYNAEVANKEYRRMLSMSRQGIDMSKDELMNLDSLVSPLIQKGQPVSHIFAGHAEEITCSQRSIYRYIDEGYLSVKNIDLRRVVRYRPRRKTKVPRPSPQKKIGHTYDCFLKVMEADPNIRVTEMDLVEGQKGGKLLMTLLFRDMSLMLAFLIPDKEMATTAGVLDRLEQSLGTEAFRELFPILLTDNGSEFADPEAFEYGILGERRTRIYYCEPRMSGQKGRLEKNHEFIRYVLPKGTSFDGLTQDDVNRMINHINSTARPGLEGRSPTDTALRCIGPQILSKLGITRVDGDDVCLTGNLFKQG